MMVHRAAGNEKGPPVLLTVEEAARYLKASKATLWRWMREGKLSSVKIGRLRRLRLEDLEQLIKEEKAVAASKKLEKRREIVARILEHRIRIDVTTAELVREGRAEREARYGKARR